MTVEALAQPATRNARRSARCLRARDPGRRVPDPPRPCRCRGRRHRNAADRLRARRRDPRRASAPSLAPPRRHEPGARAEAEVASGSSTSTRCPTEPIRTTSPATSTDRLALLDGVADLPLQMRAAVVLRYYADLSVDEVAAALGKSPNTIKAQLQTALDRLRDPPRRPGRRQPRGGHECLTASRMACGRRSARKATPWASRSPRPNSSDDWSSGGGAEAVVGSNSWPPGSRSSPSPASRPCRGLASSAGGRDDGHRRHRDRRRHRAACSPSRRRPADRGDPDRPDDRGRSVDRTFQGVIEDEYVALHATVSCSAMDARLRPRRTASARSTRS